MGGSARSALEILYGDVNAWLEAKIEQAVKRTK
jgi:hypothetical protein